jgi:N-acetylglutamate synthase-like GNAT family acetyltransferase
LTLGKAYFMLPSMKETSDKTLLKIRPATEDDIPRILELYHELTMITTKVEQDLSTSLDDYRRVFAEISSNPRRELLVAEYEGEVVGTVALYIIPNLSHGATPYALVENVVVNHKYRRKGIGKKLMEYTIVRAKQEGCHRIELCSSKRRKEAHRLYRLSLLYDYVSS